MVLVKGPKGAKAGSDTGIHLGMPPTPTVLIDFPDVFNLIDFVCFRVKTKKLICLPRTM